MTKMSNQLLPMSVDSFVTYVADCPLRMLRCVDQDRFGGVIYGSAPFTDIGAVVGARSAVEAQNGNE
jgi:hypothetical protein